MIILIFLNILLLLKILIHYNHLKNKSIMGLSQSLFPILSLLYNILLTIFKINEFNIYVIYFL